MLQVFPSLKCMVTWLVRAGVAVSLLVSFCFPTGVFVYPIHVGLVVSVRLAVSTLSLSVHVFTHGAFTILMCTLSSRFITGYFGLFVVLSAFSWAVWASFYPLYMAALFIGCVLLCINTAGLVSLSLSLWQMVFSFCEVLDLASWISHGSQGCFSFLLFYVTWISRGSQVVAALFIGCVLHITLTSAFESRWLSTSVLPLLATL